MTSWPRPPPSLADGRVFLAPRPGLKGGQGHPGCLVVDSVVDRLQGGGDGLAVLPGRELHAVAKQMNDASLNNRLRIGSRDRLGKALQPIDNGQQDVLHAPILQLVQDAQPELGALVLFDPQAQHLLGTVGSHADGDMDGLVADQTFIPDLDPDGIHEKTRG